ncbi:hypothetical protein Q8F55_003881 [Vanrija albida]|uniref:ER transporter 6TM N-terminal domain-containing protein n=1 Tax=Vanrija albida TaxID=181172 RepID=A0ABR3Q5Z1_9TREE
MSSTTPTGTSADSSTVVPTTGRRHAFSLNARLPPWASKARPMLAPVLTAFLSFVFVVVHPLNHLAGEYSFLVYTSVILFYFPQGRVSQQLESNTVNFIGALCGLTWATIGVAIAASCGKTYGSDSPQSRAVLAVWLAILSVVCGFLRSCYPRLNIACRAAMFNPIFLLTASQKITKFKSHLFLDQFFVALFAYAFATVSGVLFSEHSSSPLLGQHLFKTVKTACELIPASLGTILDLDPETPPEASSNSKEASGTASGSAPSAPSAKELEESLEKPSARTRQQQLARKLRAEIATTRATHASYMLDIVHARQKPAALEPIIHILARLQRNPLLGPTGHVPAWQGSPSLAADGSPENAHETPEITGSDHYIDGAQLAHHLSRVATHTQPRHASGNSRNSRGRGGPYVDPARAKLTMACTDLSDSIVAAMTSAAAQMSEACDWHWGMDDHKDPVEVKAQLQTSLKDLQRHLSGIIDTTDLVNELHKSTSTATLASRLSARGVVWEDEIPTTADWLDEEDRFRIAFYMIALLDLAKDTQHLLGYAVHLRQGAQPKRWIFPAIVWPWTKAPEMARPSVGETRAEAEVADDDERAEDLDFVHTLLRESRPVRVRTEPTFSGRLVSAWRSIWDRQAVVVARVLVSKALHSLKHSHHVLFAVKQTIGISLLSVPAFMPEGNSGRHWYDKSRGAWMVVSFMYVLEVTTGATLRIGFYRTLGTLIGAVVGYVCTRIAGTNPYGLVALATACAVPISYGVLFSHVAPMAIVTGITLPPIMFIQYLGLSGGLSEFTLAWMRFVDIVIGIGAAIVIGSWLWPIHARVQYFGAVAQTMDQVTEYYLRMSRDLLRPSLVYQANSKQYSMVEASVRRNIARSRTLVEIQRRELSLLPRPVKLYAEVIDLTERLIETFGEIRTLRFSLPRKATVLDVLSSRRELISAILVCIWAVGQSFRSRSPLPQVLPSPRVPLGEVMDATDEHARQVRVLRARDNMRRRAAAAGEAEVEPAPEDDGAGESANRAELAVLYGMAENEALGEAINCIDELLAAARTLFGTQSFLDIHTSQPL